MLACAGGVQAQNHEVGGRWDLLPHLTLSGALFRTLRQDVRVADPLNPGYFVKTGEQRTDGLEIGLQGDVTRRWQVYGGYAYLDGRVTQPVSTGTSAYTSFANTVTLPASTRVDAALYYQVAKATRVALDVENVLDCEYFPTADGDNNISPGAPRTVRLTLSTSF